jgi:DNA polymerase IV
MGRELTPWFALIDMNSYFATLEQQANPHLRGKPVAVVKEAGRSCVIAASKEAKKFGVHTGEPLRDAREKAPNLITVPADFDFYFHNTKQLQSIFTTLSPDIDLFSLDEAFIDLSSCRQLYPNTESFFKTCQEQIKHSLGDWVTFSMGLGKNRLQAKLASEFAGVDNYFEITPDNLDAILSQSQVEKVCGIGYRLTSRLNQLGITHVYQLKFCDDEYLIEHFGKFWAAELRKISEGEESHLLDLRQRILPHMKSVSRSKTLFVPTADPFYLEQMIFNLTEDMCFKARRMKLAGRRIYISLRDTEGGRWGKELRLKGRHVSLSDDIFSLFLYIFHDISLSWSKAGRVPKIIRIAVSLNDLQPLAELPTSWLPGVEQRQQAFKAIDQVNEKHGLYTIKSAKLLGFRIIRPEVTGFLGDKTYQMQFSS